MPAVVAHANGSGPGTKIPSIANVKAIAMIGNQLASMNTKGSRSPRWSHVAIIQRHAILPVRTPRPPEGDECDSDKISTTAKIVKSIGFEEMRIARNFSDTAKPTAKTTKTLGVTAANRYSTPTAIFASFLTTHGRPTRIIAKMKPNNVIPVMRFPLVRLDESLSVTRPVTDR